MRTHTYIYTSPREDIILSEKVSSFSCRRLIKVSNWKKKKQVYEKPHSKVLKR